MKKLAFVLLGLTLSLSQVWAQGGPGSKLQNAKIGIITNRLNLSSEQATQFWPIYNEYEEKQMAIRKRQRKLVLESNTLTASDDKLLSALQDMNSLKQQEVDLEKDYMNKFLKVINARQLFELYKAEQQFTQMLLNRLNKQEGKSNDFKN